MSNKNTKFFGLLVATLGMAFLSSCAGVPNLVTKESTNEDPANTSGTRNPTDPLGLTATLRFNQPPASTQTNKLDILFVVDTSGSLDDERAAIADGLNQFLSALPMQANVRIGVMLAHVRTDDPMTANTVEGWSGRLYQTTLGEPLVLNSETMERSAILGAFREKMINYRSEALSDGGEMMMYSLTRAFDAERLAISKNQGFFRDDAALAVIPVTDENDICSRYLPNISFVPDTELYAPGITYEVHNYNTYCVDGAGTPIITHNSLQTLLRNYLGSRSLIAAGLIYTGGNPVPRTGENEIGYGIKEWVTLAQGVFVDLADPAGDPTPNRPDSARIAAGLRSVGQFTTTVLQNLQKDFALEHPSVVVSTITVLVDNNPADFTYNAENNSVHIESPGTSDSVIEITYQY